MLSAIARGCPEAGIVCILCRGLGALDEPRLGDDICCILSGAGSIKAAMLRIEMPTLKPLSVASAFVFFLMDALPILLVTFAITQGLVR